MGKTIREIIEKENPFNPYKDDQIAEMLNTTRDNIVRMRKKENIESYNVRRKPILLDKIREIISENEDISTIDLTNELNELGFDVSRFLIAKLKNGIIDEMDRERDNNNVRGEAQETLSTSDRKEELSKNDNLERSDFDSFELIGEDGSIRNSMQLMRAAMIYPPKGLHTIIHGETGTGKSKLVDTVYKKLITSGELPPDRKLVKYNCANYANNPSLLTSQLFGHVKGAFTGADSDKDGIIKEADGGILFLDEIHRLSTVGQEMLFSVIDDGCYHRLGQSSGREEIDVMIIGATTEDINSTILTTFKRRIPMSIELPSLLGRSVKERFQLIVMMLQSEANNIGRKIMLNSFCLVNLLTYRCLGNIGQLTSDIKVTVANAYVKSLSENRDFIELHMSDFPKVVQDCVTKQLISRELDYYRDHGVLITPNESKITFIDERRIDVKPHEISDMMLNMYEGFSRQNLPESLISNLLYREIKYRISQMIRLGNCEANTNYNYDGSEEEPVKEEIQGLITYVEDELGVMNSKVKDCLEITLEDVFDKIESDWKFPDIDLRCVEKDFLMEYRIALEALNRVSVRKDYNFPKVIVGIVATYIHFGHVDALTKGNVRVVIIAHGKIASAISEVCNYYTHKKVLTPIDLPLDLGKEQVIDLVLERVEEFEEDNLLLLVDLGTPLLLGEIISRRTKKLTKTVSRVDLALALEAAIKAKKKDVTLTEIYDYIRNKQVNIGRRAIGKTKSFDNLIIVSCITGQGSANNIKAYIESNFKRYLSNVEIIPFGVITPSILEHIKSLQDSNNIVACIGSYVIDLDGVPFINTFELAQDKGRDQLLRLLGNEKIKVLDNPQLYNYVFEDAMFFEKMYLNKAEAIGDVANKLQEQGYVTKEYKYNVLKREAFISTDYKYRVAIPHTDADYVKKSVIAITRFPKPVLWTDDYECDIMFMIALKKEDVKVIKELRKVIEDKEFLAAVNNHDKDRMLEIMMELKAKNELVIENKS